MDNTQNNDYQQAEAQGGNGDHLRDSTHEKGSVHMSQTMTGKRIENLKINEIGQEDGRENPMVSDEQ